MTVALQFRSLAKRILAHSPLRYSERVDGLWRLSLLGRWIARHRPHPYFTTREELYAHVASDVIGARPITYLEFGVYEAASLRTWMRLNQQQESVFVGFDSFLGLPEAWVTAGQTLQAGTFSLGGRLPKLEDSRGRLVQGWFQETLPGFLKGFEPHRPLVVHCDADLYTSTLFVLCTLHEQMTPGTVVIMDDFTSMLHDFRAWEDYTRTFGRHYEVLAAAGRVYYEHVALRLLD